jgi:hypothetical protein
MKRIEFLLSMPSRGSWDGGWSGSKRRYAIVRKMTDEAATKLMGTSIERSWSHCWGDGWTAQVTARVVTAGERLKRSDGFCGYDWMVANILDHGNTRTVHTITPETP